MGFSPKLPTPKVGGLFKMKFGGLSKIKKCLNANMENQKERKKENFSESDFDSSVNVFVFMADVLEGIKEGLYEAEKNNKIVEYVEELKKQSKDDKLYMDFLEKKKGVIDEIIVEKEKNSYAENIAKQTIINTSVKFLTDKCLNIAEDYMSGKISSNKMIDSIKGMQINPKEVLDKFNVKEAKEMLTQGMEKGEEVVRDIMKG